MRTQLVRQATCVNGALRYHDSAYKSSRLHSVEEQLLFAFIVLAVPSRPIHSVWANTRIELPSQIIEPSRSRATNFGDHEGCKRTEEDLRPSDGCLLGRLAEGYRRCRGAHRHGDTLICVFKQLFYIFFSRRHHKIKSSKQELL